MFGLFKKKGNTLPKEEYFIYKSQTAKYRQLVVEVKKWQNENKKIAIIVFFNDTHEELQRLLSAASISFSSDEISFNNQLLVLLDAGSSLLNQLDNNYKIVLAEIHPFRTNVTDLIKLFPNSSTISCFTSMDSPFFTIFGADRILALMDNLGMEENERIEHSMVTKSIIKGQLKTEEKVQNEKPAQSIEEWVEINLKPVT